VCFLTKLVQNPNKVATLKREWWTGGGGADYAAFHFSHFLFSLCNALVRGIPLYTFFCTDVDFFE